MVRYGADKIFDSTKEEVTDEDIEILIAKVSVLVKLEFSDILILRI